MTEIKFRQAIFIDGEFHHWHYWGYVNPESPQYFVSPMSSLREFGREAKPSQQYTGKRDKQGKEIYTGDKVQSIKGRPAISRPSRRSRDNPDPKRL